MNLENNIAELLRNKYEERKGETYILECTN